MREQLAPLFDELLTQLGITHIPKLLRVPNRMLQGTPPHFALVVFHPLEFAHAVTPRLLILPTEHRELLLFLLQPLCPHRVAMRMTSCGRDVVPVLESVVVTDEPLFHAVVDEQKRLVAFRPDHELASRVHEHETHVAHARARDSTWTAVRDEQIFSTPAHHFPSGRRIRLVARTVRVDVDQQTLVIITRSLDQFVPVILAVFELGRMRTQFAKIRVADHVGTVLARHEFRRDRYALVLPSPTIRISEM